VDELDVWYSYCDSCGRDEGSLDRVFCMVAGILVAG